jgi:predicted transcriptional regulator
MQTKVLLSIKPEFASKISQGSKRYEFRRAIFKRKGITTIVVYASAPISKVIGEFEVGGILCDTPRQLWTKTSKHAGISKNKFLNYFSNKLNGYAIEIKKYTAYKEPIALKKFALSAPPQSFLYLKN